MRIAGLPYAFARRPLGGIPARGRERAGHSARFRGRRRFPPGNDRHPRAGSCRTGPLGSSPERRQPLIRSPGRPGRCLLQGRPDRQRVIRDVRPGRLCRHLQCFQIRGRISDGQALHHAAGDAGGRWIPALGNDLHAAVAGASSGRGASHGKRQPGQERERVRLPRVRLHCRQADTRRIRGPEMRRQGGGRLHRGLVRHHRLHPGGRCTSDDRRAPPDRGGRSVQDRPPGPQRRLQCGISGCRARLRRRGLRGQHGRAGVARLRDPALSGRIFGAGSGT